MDKGDQTGIAGIVIGIFLTVGTLVWPWPIPDEIRHILFWISAFFVLAGCLWLLDLHFLNKKRKAFRRGIPISLIILLGVLIAGVEWPKNSPVAGNPLDDKISLFCELMKPPKTLDGNTNGRVELYILQKPSNANNALAEIGVPVGSLSPVLSGSDKQSPFFSKCSITNYSDTSLIGVYTTLWVSFCPFKKTKNGWVGQNPTATLQINTPPLNIPPATSPNNSQFFYLINETSYLAQITPQRKWPS